MFQAFSLWGRDKEEEQETQQGGGVGSESEFPALSPHPLTFLRSLIFRRTLLSQRLKQATS